MADLQQTMVRHWIIAHPDDDYGDCCDELAAQVGQDVARELHATVKRHPTNVRVIRPADGGVA